jgi:hypothetical protein
MFSISCFCFFIVRPWIVGGVTLGGVHLMGIVIWLLCLQYKGARNRSRSPDHQLQIFEFTVDIITWVN